MNFFAEISRIRRISLVSLAVLALAFMLSSLFNVSDLFETRSHAQSLGAAPTNILDPGFTGGVTDGNVQVLTSAVQPDGKIIFGGGFSFINGAAKNTLVRVNADGSIDNSFNTGNVGPNSSVYAIRILADGKILIAGAFGQFNGLPISGITRLNPDGTRDMTFNPGGTGTTGILQGMSIQTDGKILISSGSLTAYNGVTQRSVARLNADGTLDPTFTSPFAAPVFVEDVRQQADGRIVIGGAFTLSSRSNVARLNPDGSVDTTFNLGGTGADGAVFALSFQPDGKILIGGGFNNYNGIPRTRGARLNTDGTLDTSFTPPPIGGNGAEYFDVLPDGKILVAGFFNDGVANYSIVKLNADGTPDQTFEDVIGDNTGYHVTRQADGKIILSGWFSQINGQNRRNIVRLDADGFVDPAFNVSSTGFGYVAAMAQQADGKIVAAGNFNLASGTSRKMIARFNLDGSLDTTFNSGTGTSPDPSNAGNIIQSIAIQPNGKIVVAGNFGGYNGIVSRGVVRLNADGSHDATFNPSFLAPTITAFTNDVLVQPDGKIAIAGVYVLSPGSAATALRLNADGTQDPGFFIGGQGGGTASRIVRQPDGKLLIGGNFTFFSGSARNRLVRLNVDGTVDTGFTTGTGANGVVNSFTLQPDGKILIGGAFTTYDGTGRNRIARLNTDSTLDATFDPGTGANGTVENISILPNGQFLAAGRFNTYNDVASNRLVRLNANGSRDSAFISGFDSDARFFARRTLVQLDGKVLVSGLFTAYNGQPRAAILRLYTPETTGGTQPILFVTNRNGNNDIYRMNADGTNQQQLTNAAESEGLAQWSPDGTKILYSKFVTSTNVQVWTMNADGSNKTLVSNATGYNASYDWSPNGQKILFITSASPSQASLWTMNPDGSGKSQITNSTMLDHFAKWSPDSSKIAFGRCTPTFVCDIFVVNANGTGEINLTPTNPNDDDVPDWTPDGANIVYGTQTTATDYNVAIMNANGTNKRPLTNGVPPQLFQPGAISPNGTKVAVGSRGTAATTFEIATVNMDGSSLTNVTNNAVYDVFNVWSPDSSKIVFSSRRDTATEEAYVMNADGTNVTRLTFNSASDNVSDWYRPSVQPQARAPFDFDGDGKTEVGIFRPGAGEWWYARSSDNQVAALQFGTSTDRIAPADFTGDGKTDIAIWRPASGEWYILRSEDNSFLALPFGANGDVPVPADYDADSKADIAVFRPSNSTWYILQSAGGGVRFNQFGTAGDVPVVADYDGDAKADIAIFRPAQGEWWINRSTAGLTALQFGSSADKPVQGDYTGDGKADIAFWRPVTGQWNILRSEDLSYLAFPFGANGDIPTPGDYDGDGKYDTAVFRPSQSTWFLNRSTAGVAIQQFGTTGDRPIPNAFVP